VIRSERISADIEAISRFTETPGDGATRPTFSKAWKKAVDYVAKQGDELDCQCFTDTMGNLHMRPAKLGWEAPAWLCGSHLDSVPHGGNFDGVVGVVVALEILRSAKDDSLEALPMELIVFAEEEGTTFGLGMIGSRAWVGELDETRLGEFKNDDNRDYFEAGRSMGVEWGRFEFDQMRRDRYLGLIEVHIEQGPAMWRNEERLAVVQAIAGRRQYRVRVRGEANHAGATPMNQRRDAMCGAAEIVLGVERLVATISSEAVATVGRVNNLPNAVNVIPEAVEFTIDFRATKDAALETGDLEIRRLISEICKSRNLGHEIQITESINACPMNERLCEALGRLGQIPSTVSGALHDSAVVAPHIPTAMLFIASKDGVSHNPAEFSRIEDIAAAAGLVERFVRSPTIARVNEMDKSEFAATFGGIFEDSPWIAERAWSTRPFASVGDLHEKMVGVVSRSSGAEKLALINAHPDLVGRLAREGRLGRESAAEQSAAGLGALSAEEIAAFESNNQRYREKFGFPFIICARQNRKEAILKAFAVRLVNSREAEIAAALTEIFKIAQFRLVDVIWEN
jgi:allantoate deiminase